MKEALTPAELLDEEIHGMGYVEYSDAIRAIKRYADQEKTIQRDLHKKQLEEEYIKGWNDSLNHYNINKI